MNTSLQIFSFQSLQLRVEVDEQGNPLFCAKDACLILGYSNDRDAISRHCKSKGVVKRDTLTDGGMQQLTFIDEGNLYRLIIKSHKPEAEPFEALVCDEILPSIRKTGSYLAPNTDTTAYLEEVKSHLETQKQLAASQQAELAFNKQQSTSYIDHLKKQINHLNLVIEGCSDTAKRHRADLAVAVRAQRPIAAAEEKEIADLHKKGFAVRFLAGRFYRSTAIVRRAIRNQGGAL